MQAWHTDGPHMSVNTHLPPHCINIFIPLVDIDEVNGSTEFRPGSQYLTKNFKKDFFSAMLTKKLLPIEKPNLKKGSILSVRFYSFSCYSLKFVFSPFMY